MNSVQKQELTMPNTWSTILRAKGSRARERFADRNALLILDQQIRDAAFSLDATRRALAIATAQDETQRNRLDDLRDRIVDLEGRAVAALEAGVEGLAAEAAAAIAELEIDSSAIDRDSARFAAESARLRQAAASASRRLADLRRGRCRVEATEAVRRLRASAVDLEVGPSALCHAEATLERLCRIQAEAEIAERTYENLDPDRSANALREKLEAAGFGWTRQQTALAVLERLKERARLTHD